MALSSANSGSHPQPSAPPSALGDYAAQQADLTGALATQPSYGPLINRLPSASSGSLLRCARRSRSSDIPPSAHYAGGTLLMTPRQSADRETRVPASNALALGVPTERFHMSTPQAILGNTQGLPSASLGSQAVPMLTGASTRPASTEI